mgnify:CR=1 FL=1
MALITANALTAGGSGSEATSYTTASISPGANRLVIITIHSEGKANPAAPTNNAPSVSGCGITWVSVTSVAGSQGLFTMLKGISASPSSGALTISFSGQTEYNCTWTVDEFIGVDISGTNGANAIVQAGTTYTASPPNTTSVNVTLGAFSHVNNATYGSVINKGGPTINVGSGFTQLEQAYVDGAGRVASEWKDSNDTSVDWSWSSVEGGVWAIAIEIKASASGNFLAFL